MGASLVAEAIAGWSHVSHQAFRALMKMALTAKDNDSKEVQRGLYFLGHDGIIPALLFKEGTRHASKLRAVREAVAELEVAGAIVRTEPAKSGGNAVYKLTLDVVPKPRQKRQRKPRVYKQAEAVPPTEAEAVPPTEAEAVPPTEAEAVPPTPYKEEEPLEEPLEERKEEYGVDLRTNVTVVATAIDATKTEDVPPRCREPTCELGFIYDPSRPKGQRNIRCPECNPPNVIPLRRTG